MNIKQLLIFFYIILFSCSSIANMDETIGKTNIRNNELLNMLNEITSEKKSIIQPNEFIDVDVTVKKGDSIWSILATNGVSSDIIKNIMSTIKKIQNPIKIQIGDDIKIRLLKSSDNKICPIHMLWSISDNKFIVIDSDCKNDYFSAKHVNKILRRQIYNASARIEGSLANTLKKLGLYDTMTHKIMDIFANKINFSKEIDNNSFIEVLFECYLDENNKHVKYGNILFATLKTNKKILASYLFTNSKGNLGYYDTNGSLIRQQSFAMPVKNSRITSGFGMRKHPLNGLRKMHKGIDFAAPMGSAVYATDDGNISFIGYNKGYGKYIKIRHNNSYTTLYAHLNAVHLNIKHNSFVKKGQVIGYVGRTGNTTGPHLHYEVMFNNTNIDPMKIITTDRKRLSVKEMEKFKEVVDNYDMLRINVPKFVDIAVN